MSTSTHDADPDLDLYLDDAVDPGAAETPTGPLDAEDGVDASLWDETPAAVVERPAVPTPGRARSEKGPNKAEVDAAYAERAANTRRARRRRKLTGFALSTVIFASAAASVVGWPLVLATLAGTAGTAGAGYAAAKSTQRNPAGRGGRGGRQGQRWGAAGFHPGGRGPARAGGLLGGRRAGGAGGRLFGGGSGGRLFGGGPARAAGAGRAGAAATGRRSGAGGGAGAGGAARRRAATAMGSVGRPTGGRAAGPTSTTGRAAGAGAASRFAANNRRRVQAARQAHRAGAHAAAQRRSRDAARAAGRVTGRAAGRAAARVAARRAGGRTPGTVTGAARQARRAAIRQHRNRIGTQAGQRHAQHRVAGAQRREHIRARRAGQRTKRRQARWQARDAAQQARWQARQARRAARREARRAQTARDRAFYRRYFLRWAAVARRRAVWPLRRGIIGAGTWLSRATGRRVRAGWARVSPLHTATRRADLLAALQHLNPGFGGPGHRRRPPRVVLGGYARRLAGYGPAAWRAALARMFAGVDAMLRRSALARRTNLDRLWEQLYAHLAKHPPASRPGPSPPMRGMSPGQQASLAAALRLAHARYQAANRPRPARPARPAGSVKRPTAAATSRPGTVNPRPVMAVPSRPPVRPPRGKTMAATDTTTQDAQEVVHPAWAASLEALHDTVASYQIPDDGNGVLDVDSFIASIGGFMIGLAAVLEQVGATLSEGPTNQVVVEQLAEFSTAVTAMAADAATVYEQWTDNEDNAHDLRRAHGEISQAHLFNVNA